MSDTAPPALLLAGDIGATKTDLLLFLHRAESDAQTLCRDGWKPAVPLRQASVINANFKDFDALLADFLQGEHPDSACFGVAGPVRDGCVQMTNLRWQIEAETLQKRHHIGKVHLVNDLVVTAMGTLALSQEELHTLHPGKKVANATVAVLAPGSGLGEAFLVPSPRGWLPCPSEGGHAAFAPTNETQMELLRFMWQGGHDGRREAGILISVEQLCSGLGLPTLLAFAASKKPISEQLRSALASAPENKKNPLVVQAALQALNEGRKEDAALTAVSLMVDILATEAAALVLKTMARGGLFIGGGLGQGLLPFFEAERFMALFSRGVHHQWLAEIPIHVITTPRCALLGAALYSVSPVQ